MEPTDEEIEAAAARQRAHIDSLYHAIFEVDKRGAVVLEDLRRRFVRQPPREDFSQDAMLKVFTQTHQREVIEYIVRRCNRAHGATDEPPEPEEGP